MSGWYTQRDTSTWFEASDSQAWIPSQSQNSSTSNVKVQDQLKKNQDKSSKSDFNRLSKEVKVENSSSLVSTPLTDTFFELPSNSVSDQNAWNAYVLANSSLSDTTDVSSNPENSENPENPENPEKPEKVVFSKYKRNIDIEEELTKQNLYKTEFCQSWMETGSCRYGPKCQFAHGKDELRTVIRHPKYKTEICKTFSTTGHCSYGKRCRFIHQYNGRADPESSDDLTEVQRKLQEINLSLAPDPVFPSPQNVPSSPTPVKKGSRLPFLQKLRKQL